MSPRHQAEQNLREAYRRLVEAERQHDGSNASRERLARATADLAMAEAAAEVVLEQAPPTKSCAN